MHDLQLDIGITKRYVLPSMENLPNFSNYACKQKEICIRTNNDMSSIYKTNLCFFIIINILVIY